MQQLTE